ncbi:MAG: glucosaminidase domain-containing protein [Phocaeicola coprophilus]|uniref:glucosaminidase domain-containing protein n=1 Tax=Phocaeicola coprophilus TaxID=387090 RepID=UPI0039932502|nr:glucosaminidase domain-containing protein [Bacteroides thetaiotaomicron]
MYNTILPFLLLLLMPLGASAQFYTISKASDSVQVLSSKMIQIVANEHIFGVNTVHKVRTDSLPPLVAVKEKQLQTDQKSDKRTSQNKAIPINGKQAFSKSKQSHLPELTIPNLYQEIIRNGIQHPRIVLAQAILETGWFRSPLCRNRHNLFGLTNPKTGKYYEFNHWAESVRAYYTKVQYKYKGGNYLLWLRDIGYAEDPRYVREVIKVLKTI